MRSSRATPPGPIVVIGIDNSFRHDDAVGAAVLAALGSRLGPSVRVLGLDGEAGRLVEAWSGASLAVVVDATRSGRRSGTVTRLVLDDVPGSDGRGGTHGLGLAAAVELGRALDRLPERLVVYGIEGADFREGVGLSAAVRRAVPEVVADVVREVGGAQAGQVDDEARRPCVGRASSGGSGTEAG